MSRNKGYIKESVGDSNEGEEVSTLLVTFDLKEEAMSKLSIIRSLFSEKFTNLEEILEAIIDFAYYEKAVPVLKDQKIIPRPEVPEAPEVPNIPKEKKGFAEKMGLKSKREKKVEKPGVWD